MIMEVYVNLQSIHQFLLFQIEAKSKIQEWYLVLFVDKMEELETLDQAKIKNFMLGGIIQFMNRQMDSGVKKIKLENIEDVI